MALEEDNDITLGKLFYQLDTKQNLEEIFRAIADGVLVQDQDRRVVYANPAAIAMMNFGKNSDILDHPVTDAIDKYEIYDESGRILLPNDLPARFALAGLDVPAKIIFTRNKITGREHWSEIKARAIRDSEGQVQFAVSVFRDITEQKKISEEYERASRRANHILESITDGFFALDQNWNFTYVNHKAENLLRMPRQEMLGKNIFDVFPAAVHSQTYEKLKSALSENQSMRYVECFPNPAGAVWIETSVYPSKDGLAVYFRDITDQRQAEEVNDKLAAIVKFSEDAIIGKDLQGIITTWNEGAENIYGYKSAEVIGKDINILIPPDMANDVPFIMDQLQSGVSLEHYETKRLCKNGDIIDVSISVSSLRNTVGEITGASVIARDITKQKSTESALRKSEDRFRAMIENTSDGIALLDEAGNINFATKAIERILGFSEMELIGMNAFSIIHPDDLPRVGGLFENILRDPGKPITSQFRVMHKNGKFVWIEGVGTNLLSHPNIQAIIANFRDISERKRAEETLQYQYHHDALTDLPNRTYLNEQLNMAIENAISARESVALMLIDLDRFKQINESLGHALGDRLIQEVSLRIRSCIKEEFTLARLGGDEFGILMPKVRLEEDVAKLSNKILEDFRPAFYLDKHELFISPSIGISLSPYDGREAASLLKNAEAALYRAKEYGGNTYQFYTQTMNAAAFERLTMESKLRHAIENQEFVLFYQPQIDVTTGKIVGTEELIRWQRPDKTFTLPDRFIPLAEANGLIEPIGAWILAEALRQGKIWHDAGFKLFMAINLSARQFKQKDFERLLLTSLEKSGFDPKFLELELTESVLAENPDNVIRVMNALKDRGVRFCLDDFSTGYSSLRYIKHFPVDMLKIERTFMKGIPHDLQNSAIAKSIITLGKSLNMEITAEGVESKNQLAFLRDNLCNRAQGYLFNGAMPAPSLSEILNEDRYISVVASLGKPQLF